MERMRDLALPVKVLLVDDDEVLRRHLKTRLEDSGFEVRTAAHGGEALGAVYVDLPDVVLTDLRMPLMDGMSFLDAMSRSCPEIPVVILSGGGTLGDAVGAMRAGAIDYLVKALELGDVEEALRRALDRAGRNPAHRWVS